jgi:hypothetical protein
LAGNLAVLAGVLVAATSLAAVRARAYGLFRAAHALVWLLIVFATM